MRRRIVRTPNDIAAYYELATIYFNEDKYQEAEDVMFQAYEASGHDGDVRDKWDDARVRHMRHKFVQAEAKAKKSGSDEAKAEAKVCNRKLNELLLEIYKGRVERYPTNLAFHFELGQQFKSSASSARRSRNSRSPATTPAARASASCCWANASRRSSSRAWPWITTNRRSRRFPTATPTARRPLSTGPASSRSILNDLGRAEKHLGVVASMDFSYRDVSLLLDKIAEQRDKEENKEEHKEEKKDAEEDESS